MAWPPVETSLQTETGGAGWWAARGPLAGSAEEGNAEEAFSAAAARRAAEVDAKVGTELGDAGLDAGGGTNAAHFKRVDPLGVDRLEMEQRSAEADAFQAGRPPRGRHA